MPDQKKGYAFPRASKLLQEYKVLKGQRGNFESYWQSLHDYFYIEANDINNSYYPGTELSVDSLWDSTTLESADVLASGFMNYLTPPTSKWFSLKSKNPELADNKAVSTFLQEVAEQVSYTLNKSNFNNQIISNYKGSGVYGTSTIITEGDDWTDARFRSMPIKNVCLKESFTGEVIGYFIEFEFTAEQAALKWGIEKLSDDMKAELAPTATPKHQNHPFVLYIAERFKRDIRKTDKSNLPIEAVWIDEAAKLTVDEGGYYEMPVACHRFDKRMGIPWGYSPAMKALPFARLLNAAAKTNLRSMMKATDPAVAVPDNAFLMPFNQNPRAVNYYKKGKMQGGRNDIFSFGTFGDPKAGMAAVEYYSSQVKAIMFNDTFLAFNQITKEMNNPEIAERINEKMTLLGPAVGRYISEMLNPTIIRTIGILSRKGKLPKAPDEFMMSPEYEIDLISQLAQAQRRSELNALMTGLQLVGSMAETVPSVLDKINSDEVVDLAWDIIGAPAKALRSDEELDAIRESNAEQAKQAQSMALAQQGADVVNTGADVDLKLANAQKASKE